MVEIVMQNNPPAGHQAAGSHCQAGTPGKAAARANFANKSIGQSLLGLQLFNGQGVTDSPGAAGQRGPT